MDASKNKFNFTLKNDYAFKRLLGVEENKAILKDFLECMFDLPAEAFEGLELLDKELKKNRAYDKTGVLDIKVRLRNGMRIDLEMQSIWDINYVQRSIFYVAKMYIEDFKSGKPYSTLTKCVSINIIGEGFDLNEKVHSIYVLREKENGEELGNFIEFHFFNLEKVKGLPILNEETKENRLINRLKFINANTKKERDMLAQNSMALKILNEQINEINLSPEEKVIYESRMKLKSDIATIYESRFKQGLKKGRTEGIEEGLEKGIEKGRAEGLEKGIEKGRAEGIEKGIEKGRTEGIEEGIEKGRAEERFIIARSLLKVGVSLDKITEATGLSEDEIKSYARHEGS